LSAWFQPLNLKCDILVSKFVFKWVNLCRYAAAGVGIVDLFLFGSMVIGDIRFNVISVINFVMVGFYP
jgi:hypothetical protein